MTSPGTPGIGPDEERPDGQRPPEKRSEALEAELAMLEGLTPAPRPDPLPTPGDAGTDRPAPGDSP